MLKFLPISLVGTITFNADMGVNRYDQPLYTMESVGVVSTPTTTSQAVYFDLQVADTTQPFGNWNWSVSATKGNSNVEIARGAMILNQDY